MVRSVYASILQDWLGVSGTDLTKVLLKDFPALPIVNTAVLPGTGPIEIDLDQNFPNPFRSATTLRYRVSTVDRVRLRLFDAHGNLVRLLADGFHAPGSYTQTVEAGQLAPGTYYYQLEIGGRTRQRPMVLIR